MNRERLLLTIIELLSREQEALLSVLSEYDGDKYEYSQMVMADDLRRVIESLECKV